MLNRSLVVRNPDDIGITESLGLFLQNKRMNDAHRTIMMILRKEVRAMKIKLNNIGKIHEAELELNGITAIAGENNTGKSTVGRALFTIFNSLLKLRR